MVACAVNGCKNRSHKKSPTQRKAEEGLRRRITFHRFPKDPERCKAWIEAINRGDWKPSAGSVICSEHFAKECFNSSAFYAALFDTAIPTIIKNKYSTNSVTKVVMHPKANSIQSQLDPSSTVGTANPLKKTGYAYSISPVIINKPPPRRLVSVTTQTIYIPQKPRSEEIAKSYDCKLSNYKKKVKTLQQGQRRSQKKIEELKTKLQEYKTKKNPPTSYDRLTLNQSLKLLKSSSNLDFLIKNFKTCR